MTKDLLKKIEEVSPKEKATSLIVIGFDGATKKMTITEDGYDTLYKEMKKRGWNDCRQATIASLPEVLRVISEEISLFSRMRVTIGEEKESRLFIALDQVINLLTK